MRSIFSILLRFGRCRALTWCAMLLTALALVLIVVPGEYQRLEFDEPAGEWEQQCKQLSSSTYDRHLQSVQGFDWPVITVHLYEHGWPRPFMARALVEKPTPSGQPYRERSQPLVRVQSYFTHWGGSKYHGASWSNYDNWPFDADDWTIRPWSLALDVAVALLIIALVGGVTEWRLRSRGGLLRFGLADLLTALTIFGVLLGIYTYHARLQQAEGQGGERPLPPAFRVSELDATFSQHYHGPDWLRKLVGNEYFLPFMHHVDDVGIGLDGDWRRGYQQLPGLPYLRSVRVFDALPTEAIESLQRCRRLEAMSLSFSSRTEQRAAKAQAPVLTLDRLSLLEPLHLTLIELTGDQVVAQHVEQIADFPTIRRITLQDVSATAEEIEGIRARHPFVNVVVRPSIRIFLSPA